MRLDVKVIYLSTGCTFCQEQCRTFVLRALFAENQDLHPCVTDCFRCCWCWCRYTLLHVAAGLGQTSTLQLLLDQLGPSNTIINDSSNEDGATPLHAAAMAGSVAAVQLLLARGANAGIAGCDGTQVCRQVVLGASGSERAGSAAAAVQLLLCAARMLGSHVVTEDLCVVKPTGPEGLMHKKLV